MLSLILNEVRSFLRDKISLTCYILFPLLMIYLLGSFLETVYGDETIEPISIQYEIESDSKQNNNMAEEFIKSFDDEEKITFEKGKGFEEAKKLIQEEKLTAFVVFRENKIEIFDGGDVTQNRIVTAIMNGFTQSQKAVTVITSKNPMSLNTLQMRTDSFVTAKEFNKNRSEIDYYALAMISMMTFMSAIVGGFAFVSERNAKTINRLILAPKKRTTIFLGKILGMIPQAFIQTVVLMLVSAIVYDAHFAVDLKGNLLLFLMFFMGALTLSSFGAVIGLLTKKNPVVIMMPALWIMMFFGGAFSREMIVEGFSEYLPIYIMQRVGFDITIFGRTKGVIQMIAVEGIVFIIMILIGAWLFQQKQEER